jgi:hypothetical protein
MIYDLRAGEAEARAEMISSINPRKSFPKRSIVKFSW